MDGTPTLQQLRNNSYHLVIRSSLLVIQSTLSLQQTILQFDHGTFTDIKSTIADQNTALQNNTKTLVEYFTKISSYQPPPTPPTLLYVAATDSTTPAPPLTSTVTAAPSLTSYPSSLPSIVMLPTALKSTRETRNSSSLPDAMENNFQIGSGRPRDRLPFISFQPDSPPPFLIQSDGPASQPRPTGPPSIPDPPPPRAPTLATTQSTVPPYNMASTLNSSELPDLKAATTLLGSESAPNYVRVIAHKRPLFNLELWSSHVKQLDKNCEEGRNSSFGEADNLFTIIIKPSEFFLQLIRYETSSSTVSIFYFNGKFGCTLIVSGKNVFIFDPGGRTINKGNVLELCLTYSDPRLDDDKFGKKITAEPKEKSCVDQAFDEMQYRHWNVWSELFTVIIFQTVLNERSDAIQRIFAIISVYFYSGPIFALQLKECLDQLVNMNGAVLVAIAATIGNLLQGWDNATIARVVLYIKREFQLETEPTLERLILAMSLIGATIVTTISGPIIGRRPMYILSSMLYFISGLIMLWAPNVYMLLLARLIDCFGIGLFVTLIHVYISKTAPADIKGLLNTLPQFCGSGGMFLSYCLVFSMSLMLQPSWRLMLGVHSIPPLLYFALTVFYLPDSPRWLLSKGRTKQAKKILQRGREDVAGEMTLLVEGLYVGGDTTIEEFIIGPANDLNEDHTLVTDTYQIILYGPEEGQSWIARPAKGQSMLGSALGMLPNGFLSVGCIFDLEDKVVFKGDGNDTSCASNSKMQGLSL